MLRNSEFDNKIYIQINLEELSLIEKRQLKSLAESIEHTLAEQLVQSLQQGKRYLPGTQLEAKTIDQRIIIDSLSAWDFFYVENIESLLKKNKRGFKKEKRKRTPFYEELNSRKSFQREHFFLRKSKIQGKNFHIGAYGIMYFDINNKGFYSEQLDKKKQENIFVMRKLLSTLNMIMNKKYDLVIRTESQMRELNFLEKCLEAS